MVRSSQQCSHQLSTDWGPGQGHSKDLPWKHLLCGCSSLRGWAGGNLCYFLNKYCVLLQTNILCCFLWDSFISRFCHVLPPKEPDMLGTEMQPGDFFTTVTWWVTGVLGLVPFGILQAGQQMPPSSGLCSCVLSYQEQFPGKPSILCPPYCSGSFHT